MGASIGGGIGSLTQHWWARASGIQLLEVGLQILPEIKDSSTFDNFVQKTKI